MSEIKIGDVRTMKREDLESSFTAERDWILAQAWQLMIDVSSANANRFADNPIKLDFDGMQEIIEKFMADKTPCHYFDMHKSRSEANWL